jgi:hypothetical protein
MASLDALLAVQDLDTEADQLRHRRATLPERTELEAVHGQLRELEAARAEVRLRRDELAREQRRLEDEISRLDEKATEVHTTLYSGSVRNPRELQALQEDFDSLKRRQRQLEDQVLEHMEQAEPVDVELADLDSRQAALDDEGARLTAAIAQAETEIDAELQRVGQQRADAATPLPPDVLREYEALRPRLGGIAVARLVGGNCQGCHLTLSAVEIDRIRHLPPDEPAYCDECGRLLVR